MNPLTLRCVSVAPPIYAALIAGVLALLSQGYLNLSKLRHAEAAQIMAAAKSFLGALDRFEIALRHLHALQEMVTRRASHLDAERIKAMSDSDFYWASGIAIEAERRALDHAQATMQLQAELTRALLDVELHMSVYAYNEADDLVAVSRGLNLSPESAAHTAKVVANASERQNKMVVDFKQQVLAETRHAQRVFRRRLKTQDLSRRPSSAKARA